MHHRHISAESRLVMSAPKPSTATRQYSVFLTFFQWFSPTSVTLPCFAQSPRCFKGWGAGGSNVASSITSPTQEIQEAPGTFPDWVTFFSLFSFVCLFFQVSFFYFLDMVLGCIRFRAWLRLVSVTGRRRCHCCAAESSARCLLSLKINAGKRLRLDNFK